jgi:hypothetical protein
MEESVYTAPTSVKVIRNKQTSLSGRYGFIEFNTRAVMLLLRACFRHTMEPLCRMVASYILNWAPFTVGERSSRQDVGPVHTFRVRYKLTKGVKVVIDKTTVRSKGYVCEICR